MQTLSKQRKITHDDVTKLLQDRYGRGYEVRSECGLWRIYKGFTVVRTQTTLRALVEAIELRMFK